jgi:hypothetical protein
VDEVDAFGKFITAYLSSMVPSYTDSNVHLYPDPQEITVGRTLQYKIIKNNKRKAGTVKV